MTYENHRPSNTARILGRAITIVIFFIVGTVTLFQFRYTRMWEEIGENV